MDEHESTMVELFRTLAYDLSRRRATVARLAAPLEFLAPTVDERKRTMPNIDSMPKVYDDVEECPICLEPATQCVQTECNHRFCQRCIRHVAVMHCPMCRQDLDFRLLKHVVAVGEHEQVVVGEHEQVVATRRTLAQRVACDLKLIM